MSRFLDALRHADLPVSPAEAIDAFEAAAVSGFHDRQLFKDSLAISVAKSAAHKETFDQVFDEFFAIANESQLQSLESESDNSGSTELDGLAGMLAQGDPTEMLIAMQNAAQTVGLENMWLFTQRNLYTRRILDEMGLEGLEALIRAAQGDGNEGLAGQLEEGRARLFDAAREFVEQEYRIFSRDTNQKLIEARLENISMRNIEARDRERMKQLIRKLAKRLATLHSRRRKRPKRGQLDIRRTLRKNHANDDVLMSLYWRRKKVDRPRLMVICDVSGSVATVSQFLLFFVYSLSEVVRDIRSFMLCTNLIESTEFFNRFDFDEAVEHSLRDVLLGATDYGQSLEQFMDLASAGINRNTTVLFLGDARSNDTDPRAELLARIHGQAKYVMWLNPEPESFWGIGDSEMPRYLPHVDFARRVSSVKELDRAIGVMLSRGIGLA